MYVTRTSTRVPPRRSQCRKEVQAVKGTDVTRKFIRDLIYHCLIELSRVEIFDQTIATVTFLEPSATINEMVMSCCPNMPSSDVDSLRKMSGVGSLQTQ